MPFGGGEREELLKLDVGGEGVRCQVVHGCERPSSLVIIERRAHRTSLALGIQAPPSEHTAHFQRGLRLSGRSYPTTVDSVHVFSSMVMDLIAGFGGQVLRPWLTPAAGLGLGVPGGVLGLGCFDPAGS